MTSPPLYPPGHTYLLTLHNTRTIMHSCFLRLTTLVFSITGQVRALMPALLSIPLPPPSARHTQTFNTTFTLSGDTNIHSLVPTSPGKHAKRPIPATPRPAQPVTAASTRPHPRPRHTPPRSTPPPQHRTTATPVSGTPRHMHTPHTSQQSHIATVTLPSYERRLPQLYPYTPPSAPPLF